MRRVMRVFSVAFALGLALPSYGAVLVSNVWNTGVSTYPASPTYSEMGVDSNSSGDLESAWFRGGNGALIPSAGHLLINNFTAASHTLTTYFTSEGSEVNLADPGDMLKVTWVFTPSGILSNNNSGSGLRLCVVDSPSAARIAADATPGAAIYTGYGMFMNMGFQLSNATPFQLMERATTSQNLLSSSAGWSFLTNNAVLGTTGYANGTTYTYTMTLTRNGSGGLDVVSTMAGGSIGGTGSITDTYTDSTPSGFLYDTFAIRPSDANSSAAQFDTTLFQVEFIPEPSTFVLVAAGLGLMIGAIRRRR